MEMAKTATSSGTDIESALMHQLRFSRIDSAQLREMVNAIAALNKEGLGSMRVFPRGIIGPDRLHVQAVVQAPSLQDMLRAIFEQTHHLVSGVVIFPYGVLATEAYQINMTIGGESVSASGG
jgi:DNA-directed RNA polymerase subunit F